MVFESYQNSAFTLGSPRQEDDKMKICGFLQDADDSVSVYSQFMCFSGRPGSRISRLLRASRLLGAVRCVSIVGRRVVSENWLLGGVGFLGEAVRTMLYV